ncbi:hypothetical protein HID58_090208 [Brassica napus]|uniref:KIB1-4 beta-propeller domain-containing protein n=1 Tax=Brassica napus TaxID=3708 RepID=A0ABQ7WW23_BRANA|nr:hypothetical protein HID58_090208 [Brassica napus]
MDVIRSVEPDRFLNNGLSFLMHKRGSRMLSSSSSSSGPFLRLGSMVKEEEEEDVLDDVLLFDAAKEELLTVPDKPHPHELADTTVVASSLGWGFFSGFSDRSLYISDHLNPLSSSSKVIPLPPLTALSSCQTDVFCNVAMSSSSPSDDDPDLVVAVKFLGRQLSLCRPNRDLRWTNIATPFPFLERSNLMYSNRDRKFYLPLPGSTYLCSWDLHFTPSFRKLCIPTVPSSHSPSTSFWILVPGLITGSSLPLESVSWSNATLTTLWRETLCSWCLERKA